MHVPPPPVCRHSPPRPPLSAPPPQSTKLQDEVRDRVEAAIKQQRYRATVGEIAAKAGLKLSEAEEALKALAYDSNANLQVCASACARHRPVILAADLP